MTKTEIWLRFASKEDYVKREKEIMSLLCDNDEGEEVVVYFADTKNYTTLCDKRCNERCYSKLEALLGESNVKFKTSTKKLQRDFDLPDKREVSLERIADALEEIAESLNNIECNLNACITQHGNNHFICIAGSVDTSRY